MTAAAEEPRPAIIGRVVKSTTGGPPPRLPMAAVRLATLRAADPEAQAPMEMRGASEMDGSFRFEAAPEAAGEEVVIFTVSPFYTCATAGASFGRGWPTAGALLAAEPRVLVPGDLPEVELAVEPVSAVEPATEMAPMADGVKLATDVVVPAEGAGPWPVVLSRTPYGRFWLHDVAAMFLAVGYAFVAQDMRGRFDSEGTGLAFADCGWAGHHDGPTTVEWVAAQPWCDGRVVTVGASALGITQYLLAPAAPAELLGQVVVVGAPSMYHYAVYRGGLFAKADTEQWLRDNHWPDENLELMRLHYAYDEFWRDYDASLPERLAEIRAAGLHIGGWFDIFQQATLDAFATRQHNGGEGARGRQRLILGPWTHGVGGRVAGEIEWPENAAMDLGPEMTAFADYCVSRGSGGDAAKAPPGAPVRYYVMGSVAEEDAPGNGWREAEDWPPPSEEMPLYLAAGRKLVAEPPEQAAALFLHHDPFDPVPSRGGCNLVIPAGPMDQREVEVRSDVLVFTGEELEEPVEVAGHVWARIWVSSDCLDTDVVVKLCDVYPDGRSMMLAYGGRRVRFRGGFEREELMEPGEVYEVAVDLWSTAYVFNRGHRIRVDVQASDFPHFDVNPGTGEPVHQHTYYQQAINRIHMSAEHPSRVILPRMER